MKMKAIDILLPLADYPNKEQKMGYTLKIVVGGNLGNTLSKYSLFNLKSCEDSLV